VLDELITAGNIWDSAVNEAITIVEGEEERCVPRFSSNLAPNNI
jgi:hypothetical protein